MSDARPDSAKADTEARTLLIRSMKLAAGLAVIKTAAGLASGSLGILASALDSVLDLTSSAVNYVSYIHARQPPDESL